MTVYQMATLEQVAEQINKSVLVAFDIETDGLYGKVCLAQFYQANWEKALIVAEPEIFQLANLVKQLHIVCHNVSYEVSTIQQQLGKACGSMAPLHWTVKHWDDTLLLAKLKWYTQDKYTLDTCYTYALRYDPYEAQNINKKEMQKANWAGQLTKQHLLYAATDVYYLLELYLKCKDFTESDSYKLDKAATQCAFTFQTNGLAIDEEEINALIEYNETEITKLAVPINVNSWQQVRPYIEEDESDGLALATFALEGNEKAEKVQKARKLLKLNSFLQKFLDTAVDGRIYGKFTFTTKSGRGNCRDQNLQQLPRATKQCFAAPAGNVLVMSDYAQLELRYACAVTNELMMAERFKNDEDLHQFTADMMQVPRQQSKTCNFNLLYGGSAKMLRSIFIKDCATLLPESAVQNLKRKWHNLWRTLTEWQEQTVHDWRTGKPQQTLLGRKFTSKLYTDAMNLPIQGGSAEIAKLAMHKMCQRVEQDSRLKPVCHLVNFVHDSFMWECPEDPAIYKPLAQIVAESMKSAWEELVIYTKIPDLPMPVQVLVGHNWGKLEKGEETPIYKKEL